MKRNILWIEDFDTKSSKHHKAKTKQATAEKKCNLAQAYLALYEDIFLDVIEVRTTMFAGIEYIIKHHGEFDCVILDVDMGNNLQIDMDKTTEQGQIWNNFFEHINIPMEVEEEGNKKDYRVGDKSLVTYLGENAGFYLVLFLISLGFPKERIIMFTAYGETSIEDRVSTWKEKFNSASLFIPTIIEKGETFNNPSSMVKHEELNKCLKNLYAQDYYLSRLFLYKLYNMFVEYKNGVVENYNSIFNYVCKDKKKTIDQVQELLENIFFYFPCMKPDQDMCEIYYYALKHFTESFEADYDKSRIEEGNTYRVLKLCRNWSSHNLLCTSTKLSDKMFRFLVFVEMLLFVDQKYNNNNENDTKNFIKEWMNNLWEKFKFFFGERINTEESTILAEIEKMNWKVCKNWKEIPKDMIDVYDRYGKSNDVKKGKIKLEYYYLLDAFMNSFIESGIQYDEIGCRTNYVLSSRCEGIYKELFLYAYYLLKNTGSVDIW